MRLSFILCALFIVGCGHDEGNIDDVVGKACSSDRDCDSRCFSGGDFPGGFCSQACANDNDCPDDTYCIAEAGGVCMFACPQFDCTRLGPGWECKEKDRLNGGKIDVCAGG